jgi:hypothetical protein
LGSGLQDGELEIGQGTGFEYDGLGAKELHEANAIALKLAMKNLDRTDHQAQLANQPNPCVILGEAPADAAS